MGTERQRNLSVKLNEQELSKIHALAAAGDESVGRMLRRWVTREYELRFGDAPAPKHKGRPGTTTASTKRRLMNRPRAVRPAGGVART